MDESIVKQFEQQQVGKLKLSAAIRIGAKIRPQAFGMYCSEGRTCALGAALEAINRDPKPLNGSGLIAATEPLGISLELASQVSRRNDSGWTREAIADWLEAKGL